MGTQGWIKALCFYLTTPPPYSCLIFIGWTLTELSAARHIISSRAGGGDSPLRLPLILLFQKSGPSEVEQQLHRNSSRPRHLSAFSSSQAMISPKHSAANHLDAAFSCHFLITPSLGFISAYQSSSHLICSLIFPPFFWITSNHF